MERPKVQRNMAMGCFSTDCLLRLFQWIFISGFIKNMFQSNPKCSAPGGLALEPRNLQRGAPWWHWGWSTGWLPKESDPWSESNQLTLLEVSKVRSRFGVREIDQDFGEKMWKKNVKNCRVSHYAIYCSPVFTFFTIQKHPILNGGGSRNSPTRPSLGPLWLGLAVVWTSVGYYLWEIYGNYNEIYRIWKKTLGCYWLMGYYHLFLWEYHLWEYHLFLGINGNI